ncbi:PrsW family intramembrane metalloprotease [Actinoplanes missouriensis]|uniref:PrsW family intramembrane metalloprotease n=1 Tax=Actinoplanes missouriensis TaxID=1866 RepID=UPI0033FF7815
MSEAVRPGGVPGLALARKPAFWVVFLLIAAGALRIGQIGGRFFGTYPLATVTAVGLFALLAVPFWLFVSELDFLEREPPSLRVVAFAWGGLVATTVSIPGSTALENLIAKLGSPHLAADWGAALAGPTVEEIAKTLGVVAIVLIARAQVNSVLDGVVYGALVGLGFQIVEDVVFAIGAVALAGQGDQIQPVVTTFLVRGFLAGVWSHTLFGALAGAGIGYLVVNPDRTRRHRITMAGLALFGAWASHVLWNSPLFREGLGNGALALLAVLVFKGLPPLLLILWLVRRAHDREAAYYVAKLATLRDPALITDNELRVLGSGSRRAAARRHAAAQAGHRARATVRRLQRAQARLAVDLSRASTPVPETAAASEVRAHRARLETLGHPEAVEGAPSWRHTASTVGTAALAIAVVWAALSALGGG